MERQRCKEINTQTQTTHTHIQTHSHQKQNTLTSKTYNHKLYHDIFPCAPVSVLGEQVPLDAVHEVLEPAHHGGSLVHRLATDNLVSQVLDIKNFRVFLVRIYFIVRYLHISICT